MDRKNRNQIGGVTLQASDLPPAIRVFWETAPEQFRIPEVDLSSVDYNGDTWLSVHNPFGTFIAILEIRFYA